MIKIENVEVVGWKAAIRGMRNPKNSWDRSDSNVCALSEHTVHCKDCPQGSMCNADIADVEKTYIVGPNDLGLMNNLAKGGPVHAKYRRMIVVYVDITAPLYWWKEFDTYKIGTVANSCSTMHKIADKEFTLDDFSTEHLFGPEDMLAFDERYEIEKDNALAAVDVDGHWCYFTPKHYIQMTCNILNHYRTKYLKNKDDPREKVSDRPGAMNRYWWQMIQLLPSSYNQKRTIMLSYEVLVGMYRDRKTHKQDEWYEFCEWIETLPYSEIITGGTKEK